MTDVNPLAHRYYLAEIERSARAQPSHRRTREAAARALAAARRLLVLGSLRSRPAREA